MTVKRETPSDILIMAVITGLMINADCFYKNICKRINFHSVFAEKIMTKKLFAVM